MSLIASRRYLPGQVDGLASRWPTMALKWYSAVEFLYKSPQGRELLLSWLLTSKSPARTMEMAERFTS